MILWAPMLTSLAVYSIRVRNVVEHESETLSSILGEEDLLGILKTYFDELRAETPDNESSQIILRVLKCGVEGRNLMGMIETGAYGIESVLINRKTKVEVLKRTPDVADMFPFFFLFHVPDGTDEGILILQRRGHYGIRSILHFLLKLKFEDEFPDLRLHIIPQILEKDFKKLLHGLATRIRYCQYKPSSDITDNATGGHEEKFGSVELVFKAKRGIFFDLRDKLGKIIRGQSANSVFELEDFDFDFQKVKVDLIQPNGRPRQVDLNNLKNARSYHDITDELDEMKKSPNDFDALKELAEELLLETRRQLYGRAGE
jgi:hypothetical protein